MLNSVIFFGRKNCIFSKKLHILLKKNSKKLLYVENLNKNKKNHLNKISNFDYLFSFRSYQILKRQTLKKINNLAINFHPGSPKYRGIGCTNFAIYNNEKIYGATAHLIDDKIDHGKIIDVVEFKIKEKDSLENLLNKTHKQMFILATKVIKNIIKDRNYYSNTRLKHKWSKKLWKRKDLERLYKININDSSQLVKKKIRSTNYKSYKPYISFKNYKFKLC